jgi:hypothetical protein
MAMVFNEEVRLSESQQILLDLWKGVTEGKDNAGVVALIKQYPSLLEVKKYLEKSGILLPIKTSIAPESGKPTGVEESDVDLTKFMD